MNQNTQSVRRPGEARPPLLTSRGAPGCRYVAGARHRRYHRTGSAQACLAELARGEV
jgi:hypothetical protein